MPCIAPRQLARTFLVVALLAGTASARQGGDKGAELPKLKPGDKDAKPLTVYQWRAEAGSKDEDDGLRFTWSLPKDYARGKSYDLVVVCHGTGLDYRWGHANLAPAEFRPTDIVVCPDGTSEADDGTRVFLGERRDVITFRDFVLEMSRSFPVDRIFLYGHSQGSFFVLYAAGQFPGLTEGVVAHASGAWTNTTLQGGIQSIPLAFMHGTADPVIPYGQSVGARDAFRDAGHEMLLVRRMEGYNHWPNAIRASECLDWCAAMSTTRADTALRCAEALLAPKPKDQYGYECPVPFGGAYQALKRVLMEGENHVEEASDEQKAKAKAMLERIDAEAARHVATLSKDVKSKGDLVLGLGEQGGAWLGHMLAFREDFRGVPAAEAYFTTIALDEATTAQRDAGAKLGTAWYSPRAETEKFAAVTENIGECFLLDTLPATLAKDMGDMKARAAELKLGEDLLENYSVLEMWASARKAGYARYLEMCRQFK
jgi:predicted esterase